jgi:5-methylcytosine-specific restriction protein A
VKRGQPLRRTPMRSTPKNTGPDAATRQLVYFRDGFTCVSCGTADGPFQVHHRRPRGAGGSSRQDTNSPSNLVLICPACHEDVESFRNDARERGLLLSQTAIPAECPVLWRGRVVLLCDDGTVTDLPPDPWGAA